MFRFLFPRLTPAAEPRGSSLFTALVAEARQPHWYREGKVPDTIDGRFAMLSTLVALTTVRLERDAAEGEAASVALAERFIEAMDAEHRQIGLGDPTLGKTVRKLMGALGRRVELWRGATGAVSAEAVRGSLPEGEAAYLAAELERFRTGLDRQPVGALAEGRLA